MNNRYIIILLFCGVLVTGGCKKYLDVQPAASYTETQVYGNEHALQQALTGVYLGLADNRLYGASLTTTSIELMAQRYKSFDNFAYSAFANYDYGSIYTQIIFDSLWRQAYTTILAANVFLAKIDNSIQSKVLSQAHGDQLKGEAIAIRAMMHFDLLRLFGPVYSTDSTSPAIPYYTLADGKSQPILSASAVMGKIMADLTQSLQLLAADPVTTSGVLQTPDFYTGLRNQRMNAYAVKGLMARAYLWAGNTLQAHDAALSVINDGEKWFPWTSRDAATDATNPDRIFSSELLLSIYTPQLYTNYNTWFNGTVYEFNLLAPDPDRLLAVYEGNQSDYRYSPTWKPQGKTYPTSSKYADLTVPTLPWRFLQPILRKTELYFILAETDPNTTTALNYLNTARRNRGLSALTPTADIPTELRKEYQKEFWGEGQLFFYYKRINATGVPYGAYPYDWWTVDPAYVVPLPLSETTTR